jgi:Holliday junction resolvase
LNGSIYERELAAILSGNPAYIRKMYRNADEKSLAILLSLEEKPFYVTRAAGSLGADLIALRDDMSLVIEVKSSIKSTLMFTEASGQRQEQVERLQEKCSRSGLFITYAYRLKNYHGDSWRLFSVPGNPKGNLRYTYEILPKMQKTKDGNYTLRWEEGIPLVKFVDYINQKI